MKLSPKIVIIAVLVVIALLFASFNNLGINLGFTLGGKTTTWSQAFVVDTPYYEEEYYDATTKQHIAQYVTGCKVVSDRATCMPLVYNIWDNGNPKKAEIFVTHGYPATEVYDGIAGNPQLKNKGGVFMISQDGSLAGYVSWQYRGDNIGDHAVMSLHDLNKDGKMELLVCGIHTIIAFDAEYGTILWSIVDLDCRLDHTPVVLKEGFDVFVYTCKNSHGSGEASGLVKRNAATGVIVDYTTEPIEYIGNGGITAEDLNGDGVIEILLGDRSLSQYSTTHGIGLACFDKDLNLNWKIDWLGCSSQPPQIIPDMNNNGGFDILVTQQDPTTLDYRQFMIYDGHWISGNIPSRLALSPVSHLLPEDFVSGAVGDIDNDYHYEYLVVSTSHMLVFDLGSQYGVTISFKSDIPNPHNNANYDYSPIIANVIGTSDRFEFLQTDSTSFVGIDAFWYEGSTLHYSSFVRPNSNYVCPWTKCLSIADYDQDGYNDIIQMCRKSGTGRNTISAVQVLVGTEAESVYVTVKEQGYTYRRNFISEFSPYYDSDLPTPSRPKPFFNYCEPTNNNIIVNAAASIAVYGTTIVGYNWDFGDGTYFPGYEQWTTFPIASHHYTTTGYHTITLHLKNNLNVIGSVSKRFWSPSQKSITILWPNTRDLVLDAGVPVTLKWTSTGEILKVRLRVTYMHMADYTAWDNDQKTFWAIHPYVFLDAVVDNHPNSIDTYTWTPTKDMVYLCKEWSIMYPQSPFYFDVIEESPNAGGTWSSCAYPFSVSKIAYKTPWGWFTDNEGQKDGGDGDTWDAGSTHDITWTHLDNAPVDISLWKDVSGTWVFDNDLFIGTPNDGVQSWTIPASKETGYYKIIINERYGSTLDETGGIGFIISNGGSIPLKVAVPNGLDQFGLDQWHDIKWNYNTQNSVDIDLYKGGTAQSNKVFDLWDGIDDDRTYSWYVNYPLVAADDYLIKISDSLNPALYDFSDAYFSITSIPAPPSGVNVVYPNDAGVAWSLGETHNILYTTTFAGNVNLNVNRWVTTSSYEQYFHVTTPCVIGSNSYPVTVTQDWPSDDKYFVEITSGWPNFDVSDNLFTVNTYVNPTITVTSPNGGEAWDRGIGPAVGGMSSHTITWDYTGTHTPYSNTDIQLWKKNSVGVFEFYRTIDSGVVPWSNQYVWRLDNSWPILSNSYKVKLIVKSPNQTPIASDMSDNPFSIVFGISSDIELTTQNTYSYYQTTKTTSIQWASNMVGNVNIELYKGTTLKLVIAKGVVNNKGGSYSWKIPATIKAGNDYKIKIIDTKDSKISDSSNTFAIGTTVKDPYLGILNLDNSSGTPSQGTPGFEIVLLFAALFVILLLENRRRKKR
jgi:hypothetical protein